MHIAGIGVIANFGRGVDSLEKALRQGWVAPRNSVYSLGEGILKDKLVLKDLRRADDFSKMACLAAYDAFGDSGLAEGERESLGIILATAFGPHNTTFHFLDDILTYGDAGVSPTLFSNSVHNAAASYIAFLLQSGGPALTVTQFADSFHQAIMLAQTWIKEGRCRHVLVGSCDQCGKVLEYICSRKLRVAQDGTIRPFLFNSSPVAVPAEGSVFFLVSESDTPKRYCSISSFRGQKEAEGADMLILDCDGMAGSEEPYLQVKTSPGLISSYTPIFGSMLTVSSFSCAAGALMLKNQQCYASPVQDNPHALNICVAGGFSAMKSIACVRYGCNGERFEFLLTR